MLPWKWKKRKAALNRHQVAYKRLKEVYSDADGVLSKLMMLEKRFVELQERAKVEQKLVEEKRALAVAEAKASLEAKAEADATRLAKEAEAKASLEAKAEAEAKKAFAIASAEADQVAKSLPDYWEKVKAKSAPDGFAAIALDRTDPTFATLGRFLETDKDKLLRPGADRKGTSHDTLKLACAWRLENPVQFGKYMSGVQQVANDMERIRLAGVKPAGGAPVMTSVVASALPGQLRVNVNEAFLMHGTGADVVIEIISKGMNERFAGAAAGTMFGQGSYLAEDAGKCDQYTMMDMQLNAGGASDLHKRLYSPSVPHPGKVFYILVCRVALGFHVRTEKKVRPFTSAETGQPVFPVNERELGPVPGISAPAILHHSLLADVLHSMRYRELLVFHSDYIYPEYLLGYQRFQSVGGSLKGPYDGVSH
jgi:hypothetical protein